MLKKQSNNIKLIALFIAIILIIIALVFGVSKFILKDQDENTPIQFNEYKVQEQEIVLSSEEYTGDSIIVTVTPSILPVVNSGKTGIDVMKLQYQITEPDAILSNNDNDWIDYIEPVEVDHNSTFNTRLVTRGHTDTSLEMDYTSPVTSREINNIAVAQLGNKTYKTLAEAITAWGDLTTEEKQTSTIQMLANTSENIIIPQTEEIKIDLCGFDIIEESSETPTIIVNGVLNIVDSGKTENNSTTYGKVTSTSNTAIKVTGANSELVLGTNESANGEDDEEVNKEGPVINGGTGSNGVLVEQGGNLEFYDGKITAPKTAQAGANTAIVVNNTPVGNENGNLITVPTGYRLDLSDDETAGREIATVVKKMMVSFDSNGGEPSNIADIEVGEGKAYGKYAEWPSDPTREGYTFGGWKTVENLISTNPSDWEQGGLQDVNGEKSGAQMNSTRIRLKNYLPVSANTVYNMNVNNSESIVIRHVWFYNANKEYISTNSVYAVTNLEFITPTNCAYIKTVLMYRNETTEITTAKVIDANLKLSAVTDATTIVSFPQNHTLTAIWTPNTYTTRFISGNLMDGKKLVAHDATLTENNNIYTVTTNSTTGGCYIPDGIFEDGKKYKLSFNIQKKDGELVNIAGHAASASKISYKIDGIEQNATYYSVYDNIPNDENIHTVEFEFIYDSSITNDTDKKIYIQPNRKLNTMVIVELSNIQIYEIVEDSQKVYGTQLGTLQTPERTAYLFDGWYTQQTGGTEVTSSTNVPSQDTTYYAHWTPAVASTTINGTTSYYRTVQAAIGAIPADGTEQSEGTLGTVTLLYDGTREESVVVSAGQNVLFNTNEKTLTSATNTITNNGKIKITGAGRIESTNTYTNQLKYKTFSVINNGDMIFEQATIYSSTTGGIYNDETGKLVVNSGTINVNSAGIVNDSKKIEDNIAAVEINDIQIITNANCIVNRYSYIHIKDGTYTQNNNGGDMPAIINGYLDGAVVTGKIKIDNARVTASNTARAVYQHSSEEIEINGGTYNGNISVSCAYGKCILNDGIFTGTQSGINIHNGGEVVLGNKDDLEVKIDSPIVISNGVGVVFASGKFDFYDGIIKAPTGQTISGTVSDTPEGYYVTNGTDGSLETAYLENDYTVTYDYNGATSGNTDVSKTVTYGENYGTLPAPTKTGYTFAGWNGKNLLDIEGWLNSFSAVNNGTMTKGNGSITVTASANDAYTHSYGIGKYSIPVESNKSYTLSWKADENKRKRVYVFVNGRVSENYMFYADSFVADKITFTTPQDAEYIAFRVGVANEGDSITYSDIQFEEGTTSTQYEPYIVTSTTPVTQAQNHTLKAIWTPNTYSISYNANDGTGSMSNQTMTYGTAANLTANSFTRTGYEFAGWNTAADGSGTSYTDAQSVSNLTDTNGATVTLYANWTANTYTVTFDANGGTMNSTTPTTAYTQNYGTTITMNNPTRDGYQFMGWVSDQRQNVTTAGYWTYANSIDPLTGERLEIINDDDHRLNGYAGGTAYVADPTSPSGWYITSAGTGATVTTSTVNYTEEDPNPLCINATSFYRITRESYTDARFSYGPIKNMPFIERDVNKIYVIVARFPEGWRLTHITNSGLGKQKWLTSNAGTGDWETYVAAVESSDNAAYQNSGYFYISNTNSNTNTVNPTLDVAYLQGYFTNKQSETANVNQFKVGAINETLTAKWQAVNQSVVINESDSNASYKVNASNLFDKTDMIITNSKIVSKSPAYTGASINQADDTHFISGLIRVIPGATYKITGATEDGLVEWFTTGKNASLYSRETQATTYTNDTNFTPPTTYTLYSNSSTQPVTYTYMRFHAKTSDINNIQLQMVDSPTYTGNKTFVFPNNASVDVISTPLAGYTTAITKTSGLGTFTTSTSGDIVTGSLANVAGAESTTNLAITNTPTVNPNNGTLNRTRGAVNSLMSTNMNNFEAEAIDTNNGTTESETVESNISSYNYEVIPQQENGTEHEVAATLADAIATASSGEIIKVINSVTEDETATNSAGKTITIDLNGKTITSTATNTINNQGILTIKGTGIIKNEIENGIVIYNTGSLNMEDGVVTTAENGGKAISNNGDGSNYQGSDTNNVEKSGTVNIKSGKIVTEGIGAIGLYNANNAKANISGGIFETRNYASKAIYNDSELEIENAKVVVSDYDSKGIYNGKNSKSCIIKETEIFIEAEEIENYELIKNTDQFKEYIDKLKPSYGIYNDSDSEVIIETATIKAERLKSVGIMNNTKGTVTFGVDESKDGKEIELNNASPIVYAISDNTTAIINNKDGIINFYDGRVLSTSTIKNMIVNVLNNYEIYEELNSNVINTTLRLIVEEVESGSVDSNSEEISENESSEENENADNESEDI